MTPPRPRPLLVALIALAAAGPALAKAPSCAQACLLDAAHRYLDAMVAHTPDAPPWAGRVRYSENGVPMMIGDALWGSITARSQPAIEAADPETGQVAWIGSVEEHGQPGFLALRMKVSGGRIADVETVARRRGGPPEYGDPAANAHDPSFAEAEPKARRLSRGRLASLVDGYFASLQPDDGRPRARFAPGCARRDNGVLTTDAGPNATGGVAGCEAQIRAGVFKAVGKVRLRGAPVIDQAKGVVVATGFIDYPDRAESYAGADGRARPAPARYPFSLAFIAAFKIRGGAIWRIETVEDAVPYLMPEPMD
jgi:hypothetical protein